MLSLKNRYGGIIKPSIKLAMSLVLLGVITVTAVNVLELIPWSSSVVTGLTEVSMGIAAIVLLLFYGQQISDGIRNAWKSNPELFEITYYLIQVLAVAIAYVAFRSAVNLLFPGWYWAYSVGLLAIALIPGIKAAVTIVNSVDKWYDGKKRLMHE